MRSPSWPRITGRLELGPKYLDETPGRPCSVSPSELPRRSTSLSPERIEYGAATSPLDSGLPVITTVSGPGATRTGAASDWAWACVAHTAIHAPAATARRRAGNEMLFIDGSCASA